MLLRPNLSLLPFLAGLLVVVLLLLLLVRSGVLLSSFFICLPVPPSRSLCRSVCVSNRFVLCRHPVQKSFVSVSARSHSGRVGVTQQMGCATSPGPAAQVCLSFPFFRFCLVSPMTTNNKSHQDQRFAFCFFTILCCAIRLSLPHHGVQLILNDNAALVIHPTGPSSWRCVMDQQYLQCHCYYPFSCSV